MDENNTPVQDDQQQGTTAPDETQNVGGLPAESGPGTDNDMNAPEVGGDAPAEAPAEGGAPADEEQDGGDDAAAGQV
ncbi:MAG TPA: hypothetical protein VLA88_02835 [Candidatus Saccharimonadales bacterium]|nr:hypothetical protein [Candidatus Saccharimonadales bacterium]